MATVHGVKKFLLLFIGDSLQTQLTLRLTTSNVYYYKKIDEFGEKLRLLGKRASLCRRASKVPLYHELSWHHQQNLKSLVLLAASVAQMK